MLRKMLFLSVFAFLLVGIYGCVALLAGTAGGVGTAVWLSGKLSQEFRASYVRTLDATESALKSLDLGVEREAKEKDVTQFRSKYKDGKAIWIDVRRISEDSTKVEVRVGAVNPDKIAADRILKRIQSYL